MREVCLNDEVVVFQPRTVTPPHLGSVANVTTFIYIPPALSDYIIFWIILVLTPYYPLLTAAVYCQTPLSLLVPAFHLLSLRKAPPA